MKTTWYTSSYSGGTNHCVACRIANSRVQVRDSKSSWAGHLTFDALEWSAFVAAATEGEL
ncbi:DUF397 domain-containing protein [Spiractinospora alimapuensis]|uniref:DUF397 domain-containing protein n=1 Tax=Spiractinospora alimapuensis TaxID=2820884 RepID=UPI001F454B45|nr:DUF397 domain-containing protein [Spiractinospora alimapuensis]QVQ52718.1 DUF397 domain-containing protein [Spiractinospora alimapuensis]